MEIRRRTRCCAIVLVQPGKKSLIQSEIPTRKEYGSIIVKHLFWLQVVVAHLGDNVTMGISFKNARKIESVIWQHLDPKMT